MRVAAGWMATALLGVLMGTASLAVATSQQDVEESLTCQCGCGLTVHSCNHLQCGSGEPIKKEISERIARGEDKDTILAAFRTQYGEKVLSAPTFGGFNRLAWITPYAAVLLAGLLLTMRLARRARAVAQTGPLVAPPTPQDTAGRARLDRALADFDRDV